jgi:hypothetical protein
LRRIEYLDGGHAHFARRFQIDPEIIKVNASLGSTPGASTILRTPTQTALIAELMQRWSDRDGKTDSRYCWSQIRISWSEVALTVRSFVKKRTAGYSRWRRDG